MYYNNLGMIEFIDLNDLILNYLSEMGLGVLEGGYLYDQDTGIILEYKGAKIKITINGIQAYAGMNELVYDVVRNYGITNSLFGKYLDKCQDTDDGDILQGYIGHFILDSDDKTMQKVTVRTKGRGDITSKFYKNVFLAFIDCTFRISGYNIDLSAFDIDYDEVK